MPFDGVMAFFADLSFFACLSPFAAFSMNERSECERLDFACFPVRPVAAGMSRPCVAAGEFDFPHYGGCSAGACAVGRSSKRRT